MRSAVLLPSVLVAPLLLAPSTPAQCMPLPSAGLNGCGLSTPFGLASIACSGAPSIGNAAFAVTASLPCLASPPVLFVGTCLPAPIPIPGPFGTNGFCGPTMAPCVAFVGPTIIAAIPGAPSAGGFLFPLPIPNDPALIGGNVCVQGVNACGLFLGSCLMVSHGISITVL